MHILRLGQGHVPGTDWSERRSVCESRAYADIITSVGNNLHGNRGMALKVSEILRRNDIGKA
jgi:hypothetical protein